MLLSVFGPKDAVEPGNGAAALAHLAQDFICARLAAVDDALTRLADDLVRPIAQQRLGAFVEENDIPILCRWR